MPATSRQARAELKHAERLLSESARRREARDLPAGEPVPATAEAARAAAEEVRVTAQSYADRAREAEELAQREERAAAECEREADRFRALADKLASLVEGAGLSLPEGVSAALPEGDPAVAAALVEERQTAFTGARTKLRDDERGVRQLAEAVRRVAASPAFSELKAQARERMGAETEELAGDCERIATQLAPRLEVIEARLAELDHDRKILVEALQKVGDEAGRLLRRAQRASALPTTLGAWAGKPYLRIHFQFPEADEEQRARLEPLVDRLVKKADIPSGLELVKLAVAELAGERGFDARILKPDAVLRPEPIPITAMNTFSRGQQLTASILLYCTLVQLRARSRGRGAGPVDAGILVLDNPIGTCSSVPLLELQRSIAREMRVQLIYATGVDDLEALETLPSKIRLRNTLRDRASGDFHVSHESAVEAVHVTSVGGG